MVVVGGIAIIALSSRSRSDFDIELYIERTWTTFAATQYFLQFSAYNGRILLKLDSKIPKLRRASGKNMEKCFCEITRVSHILMLSTIIDRKTCYEWDYF